MSKRKIYSLTTGQRKALRQWLEKYQLPFRVALDRYPKHRDGTRDNYPCLRLRGDSDVMVVAHFQGKTVRQYSAKRGKNGYRALPSDYNGIVAVLFSLGVSAHSLAAGMAGVQR